MAWSRNNSQRSYGQACEPGLSAMESDDSSSEGPKVENARSSIIVLFAAAIFLGCIYGPPNLIDDVDGVQAKISRNMLNPETGSPRLNVSSTFAKANLSVVKSDTAASAVTDLTAMSTLVRRTTVATNATSGTAITRKQRSRTELSETVDVSRFHTSVSTHLRFRPHLGHSSR
jgi:hypothetical protein